MPNAVWERPAKRRGDDEDERKCRAPTKDHVSLAHLVSLLLFSILDYPQAN